MAAATAGDTGDWLVGSDWLADHLGDGDLRIIDCTIKSVRREDGGWGNESGRGDYESGHIPGALFVDLLVELQDAAASTPLMLPDADDFAGAVGALGIGNQSQVVVYTAAVPWWATRFWWMLRAFGHDRVAVLDGGLDTWRRQGRPLHTAIASPTPARFDARYRPELVAGKEQVFRAINRGGAPVVNALSWQLHTGESNLGYARPGRIANSENLSALSFIDRESGCYLPPEALAAAAASVLPDPSAGAICYCGGGIAATMTAFVLTLLGHDPVSVYDGSLNEWAADPEMPMETG